MQYFFIAFIVLSSLMLFKDLPRRRMTYLNLAFLIFNLLLNSFYIYSTYTCDYLFLTFLFILNIEIIYALQSIVSNNKVKLFLVLIVMVVTVSFFFSSLPLFSYKTGTKYLINELEKDNIYVELIDKSEFLNLSEKSGKHLIFKYEYLSMAFRPVNINNNSETDIKLYYWLDPYTGEYEQYNLY